MDNEHVMVKAMSADEVEETILLGFAQPREKETIGYIDAIKRAESPVIPWSELLPLLSSIAIDGQQSILKRRIVCGVQ